MPEARRSQQDRTLLGAKIIYNNRASVLDCVVRNISSFSAELTLAVPMWVPTDFELHIPIKYCSYRAEVVRRDADGVEVEFYPDSKRQY
jgi:hypothetical protein